MNVIREKSCSTPGGTYSLELEDHFPFPQGFIPLMGGMSWQTRLGLKKSYGMEQIASVSATLTGTATLGIVTSVIASELDHLSLEENCWIRKNIRVTILSLFCALKSAHKMI